MFKPEIAKKTQKIATATYLVTGFFDEKEPLKWKLRTKVSDLVSNAISIKDNNYSDANKAVVDLRQNLSEIESLFTIANHSGLVSDMNFNILRGELVKCLNTLETPPQTLQSDSNPLILKDYFSKDEVSTSVPATQTDLKDKISKETFLASSLERIEKSTEEVSINAAGNSKGQNIDEKTLASFGSVLYKRPEPKALREFGAVAVKKNSRQSVIIGLLKRKKEIMIKDVSSLIDGCSEKTIQRELLNMVKSGILHKEGEKRWSKYSLAKSE